jgi:hypothetical protein
MCGSVEVSKQQAEWNARTLAFEDLKTEGADMVVGIAVIT